MNITLHTATEQVRTLLDQVDPETGEVPDGFESARAVVAAKAQAVTAYIIESERAIASANEYAKELQARLKSAEKRAEWLRHYLAEHMAAAGITEIKDERGVFSAKLVIGRDKSVEVFDAAQLPQEYLREIPAKHEPDKSLIKKALDDGHEVPGARVVAKNRLTIK